MITKVTAAFYTVNYVPVESYFDLEKSWKMQMKKCENPDLLYLNKNWYTNRRARIRPRNYHLTLIKVLTGLKNKDV